MKEPWIPLFAKIVDSSLWSEPDYVVKVFLTMIAKKGPDHIVRASAFNIGQWAKKDEIEVIEAIKILCSPDAKRIEPQPFDGRRLQKVDGGWLILNGQYYHKLMKVEQWREYNKIKQAEYRRKKAQKALQGEITKPAPIVDPPYVAPTSGASATGVEGAP